MKLINLNHPNEYRREGFPAMVMALGYFDGVHLGHQQVIKEAKKMAETKGLKSAVMTFDPHPSVVLGKSVQHMEYITPLDDKTRIIGDMGVDYLFVVNFSIEFSSLLPQEFVDQYIIGLNVHHVVAGFDYSYGKMGKGNMETIQFHSRGQFDFTVVSKLSTQEEDKVSSTLIRTFLRDGKVEEMPALLGRFYTTKGTVINGERRGRTIGFPTANVQMEDQYILPPTGVYAVKIQVEGAWHEGVCNVGYKPTFHREKKDKPSVEVHIFDFNKEIYGESSLIEWHLRLRSERKFEGIQQLVAQIEKDKQEALLYFEKNKG
ncbi:bifunctional riboflavin kinase/FAD synthetase [Mesobacillus subterraneus]|uniref:bifunctional riboflavin kinase/FAD synthetase n=1 Tax=Mesobacillus subterraneus TaxID=285983 RepID=UPI00273FF4E1|nr:bifunctional riboflavin kinase/FAD synthetase [Mesobacillus subterraneus]WLR53392.1 bifunctional riboflavin kinase/FAD synthetase [Mesobacillus subterraneus]